MNFSFAITVVAVLISCAYSAELGMEFPNCHRSDSFNNAIEECVQQILGEEAAAIKPENRSQIDPEKKTAIQTCISQKLGFECHGTITADDVSDIMATIVTSNEEIRAALTTDVTNCITENQNEGPKVMKCVMGSLIKNCS